MDVGRARYVPLLDGDAELGAPPVAVRASVLVVGLVVRVLLKVEGWVRGRVGEHVGRRRGELVADVCGEVDGREADQFLDASSRLCCQYANIWGCASRETGDLSSSESTVRDLAQKRASWAAQMGIRKSFGPKMLHER